MPSLPILKASGLQTAPNAFSGVPDGALQVAKNVVVYANHTLEPRRGHKQLSYTLSATGSAGAFYGTTLYAHHGTSISYDTGSAFTTVSGTFTAVDDALLRMKFVEFKKNFYVNTATGVKVSESSGAAPRDAGLPVPQITSAIELGGGTGFPDDSQMSFRAMYWRRDANGTEYFGPPSPRWVIINSSGAAAGALLTVRGPTSDLPSGTRLRFYRTDDSGSELTDPGDDHFLFYETTPPATLDAGDSYSFDQLGPLGVDALYTNPRQEGILQANDRPPIAKDIAVWNSRLWFANTTGPHRFSLELLGYGSPDGLQQSDTISINGDTFTADNTGAILPPDGFDHDSYSSIAETIMFNTRSLIASVNHPSATAGVEANYIATSLSSPGKLVFESRTLGGSAFTVYASRAASWNPELTTSSSGALSSDNNRLPNGLFYSKPDQPEAVPLTNYLLVGAANKEILRILPLREKLYVFKEDGIFTVAGDLPFRVDQLDATTRLIAPDSAVVVNNQILALTNQGVVAVSDAGIQLVSRPIEDQLLPYLTSSNRSTVKRYTFGLAHETDRVYELWVPTAGGTSCTSAFVYNTLTNAWTTWEHSTGHTFGAVDSTDVRYYGGDSSKVLKERRDFASTDYADETLAVTISSISGSTVNVSSSAGITVGDALTVYTASDSQNVTVTAINGNALTVSEDIVSVLSAATTGTIHYAFECDIQWTAIAFDRPGTLKRFQYGNLHFGRPTAFNSALATYETETTGYFSTETLSTTNWGWGTGQWGVATWGDNTKSISLRHTIPAEQQRGAMAYPGFRIREAFAGWKLQGLTLDTEETSERPSR
jgi:hypothetical protein